MKKEDKIPTLNIKLEERIVESKIVYTSWIVIETPYMIFSDKNGTRKIWTKNKKKIECPCGGHFYNTSISIHNKTEIHKTYLKIQDLESRLKEAGL
jgi:hypothetical protein